MELLEIRKEIDKVDNELVKLIEDRMKLSKEVAEYKKDKNMPIYDKMREEDKIITLKAKVKNPFSKEVIGDLFSQIMSLSRRLQYMELNQNFDLGFTMAGSGEKPKVVCFGESGAYTEQAMIEYFGEDIEQTNCNSFEEVMALVKSREADFGVLPIENSYTGTLSDIFDLLSQYNNYIVGEHVLKIEHNLLGLNGANLEDIKTVYSHKQGILQCSTFLKENEIKALENGSTSASAKRVLEENNMEQGAIASKRAAKNFGLKIIKEQINNELSNSTRFIIITNKKIYFENANKISLCFSLPHESGSLYRMISHFIHNSINMTRIESRPLANRPFEYRFFIDIEGDINESKIKNALYSIEQEALEMKILGVYKGVNGSIKP